MCRNRHLHSTSPSMPLLLYSHLPLIIVALKSSTLHCLHTFGLPPSGSASSVNLREMLFTQCLSSVGVGNPSPLNTCPKCEPQLEHTISVRVIPNLLSSNLFTAPGIESKYAGHPHPDLNFCDALYNGALQAAQVYTPCDG